MDREHLEQYSQREYNEFKRLVEDRILNGTFSLETDRYPPDARFIKLQKPFTHASLECAKFNNLWTQIPFSGSLFITIPPYPKTVFEKHFFKVSEIPNMISFIKETGKIQIVLNMTDMRAYEGLDYLDPIFEELKPPICPMMSLSLFVTEKEIQKATDIFFTLAKVRYLDYIGRIARAIRKSEMSIASTDPYSPIASTVLTVDLHVYITLKLFNYAITEEIKNLMIDSPEKAAELFRICGMFIVNPLQDLRCDLRNFSFEENVVAQVLPIVYRPQEMRFPCEIGSFLLSKLTYAPLGLDACKELMYHYDAYDLRRVQEALNEGIVTNRPDIINKNVKELSEILDNVWNDKTIPRRVKGLHVGIPLLMAAVGSVAAGSIGTIGGFLAGLGYSVVDRFIDLDTEGLSERLAKLKIKSYQANVYDFKEKYKHNIPKPSKESQTNA